MPTLAQFAMLSTAIPAAFAICFLISMYERHVATKWRDKWPPIDDDEFVRRCPPGTRRDTALRVRRIVADQLGIDYDRVYPEQSFVDDLGV